MTEHEEIRRTSSPPPSYEQSLQVRLQTLVVTFILIHDDLYKFYMSQFTGKLLFILS